MVDEAARKQYDDIQRKLTRGGKPTLEEIEWIRANVITIMEIGRERYYEVFDLLPHIIREYINTRVKVTADGKPTCFTIREAFRRTQCDLEMWCESTGYSPRDAVFDDGN